jgi:flagellar motor protein MotB
MKRLAASLLVAACLLAPAAGLAQERDKKPPPPPPPGMAGMMPAKPDMMLEMMTMWWNMGAMSQQMSQMLEETGEILSKGNLTAEAQKQLAPVTQKMGELVSQMFGPLPPLKQQEFLENLRKLKGQLEAVETSVPSKASGK